MMVIAIVIVSIQAASLGSELMQIEKQISLIETENRKLMSQTIEETALTRVRQKAQELGMVKADDVYYLGQMAGMDNKPVAQLP